MNMIHIIIIIIIIAVVVVAIFAIVRIRQQRRREGAAKAVPVCCNIVHAFEVERGLGGVSSLGAI